LGSFKYRAAATCRPVDGDGADDKGVAGVGVTSDPEVVFSGDKGNGVAERVGPLPPAAAGRASEPPGRWSSVGIP
jgi:hypothetical protein